MMRPSPSVVFTRLSEEEAVLLHLQTKQYYSLNETGIVIWEGLDAGKTTEEIATDLATAYEVEAEEAHAYVQEFLQKLADDDLVDEA